MSFNSLFCVLIGSFLMVVSLFAQAKESVDSQKFGKLKKKVFLGGAVLMLYGVYELFK